MKHRPFLWVTLGFMAGLLTHHNLSLLSFWLEPLCAIVLGLAFAFRRRSIIFAILILTDFFLLGCLYPSAREMPADNDIIFQKKEMDFGAVSLRGIVDADLRRNDEGFSTRISFTLNVTEGRRRGSSGIKPGSPLAAEGLKWQKLSGRVLVNLFQDQSLNFGDDIVLSGKLHRPFEFSKGKNFSYRDYLKRQGIFYVLSVKKNSPIEILQKNQSPWILRGLYQCRHKASALINKNLNSSEAALIQAMILGERLNISPEIKDIFAKTGTTHILAISGLNVGIVVMVLFLLLRMVPGPAGMIYGLTGIFIILYVIMTGASPSVVRAGVMSAVFLTSFIIERETDSVNSLSFAAFLLFVIDPDNIFDIGFQLSFASVLAILVLYPLVMQKFKPVLRKYHSPILKFFIESFAVSLTATAGVGGLIVYYFHIVTPVSLLANLAVVPLSTLATILGIGLVLSGGYLSAFAFCIHFVLNLMVSFMNFCQNLPLAYFYLKSVNIWGILSYYLIIAASWMWLKEPANLQTTE